MAPNTYTITIRNENGSDQNYSLINKKPIINGMAQEQIFSNVLCNLSTAAGQVAEVAIRPHYKAVVGTRNGDDGSVRVRVGMSRDVKLGEISSEGTVINGTTLEFALAGNGTPTFSDAELPSAGIVNAFAIKAPTNKGWDKSDAKAGNWVIGLGLANSQGSGPSATFTPEPGVTYQIQPSNTFYLVNGRYEKDVLIDVAKIGNVLAIDFAKLPGPRVTIVHGREGVLSIQRSPDF